MAVDHQLSTINYQLRRSIPLRTLTSFSAAILLLLLSVGPVANAPALAEDALESEAGVQLKFYESVHYRLGTNIDEVTSKEYSRVLELAWAEYEKFFDGAPKLKKSELLDVFFLATQEDWQTKMKEDRVGIPIGAGGYYNPGNKSVYLFRQPTLYNSRQLLIHEAMHQFHYLAKCNNTGPKDVWYIEGVVEHLSRHYWDGEKLTLGVVPFCSLANYPKLALELFEREDYDLGAMVSGDRASARPEQWALVRYLLLEGDAKKWKSLTKKLDGGQAARNVFKKTCGDPAKLQPKIHEWLKTQQEPFVPVWNEWQGQGANAAMGTAAASYSMCRTSGNAGSVAADVLVGEGNWQGGLLVYFRDTKDYAFFMVDQSGGWIVTRGGDTWATPAQGRVEMPKTEGSYRLKAVREGDAMKLFIDDAEVGSVDFPESALGVCLRNSTVRFQNIEWK